MKTIFLAVLFLALPALGSTLRCEPSSLVIFSGLKIVSVRAAANSIVVEGEAALTIVPEQHQEMKYSVSKWNWENGLTITGLTTEMTTGQHGSATLRVPALKAVDTSTTRAYSGSVLLMPSSMRVAPRVGTRVPVHCFFTR